jgi:hypothetical protein
MNIDNCSKQYIKDLREKEYEWEMNAINKKPVFQMTEEI